MPCSSRLNPLHDRDTGIQSKLELFKDSLHVYITKLRKQLSIEAFSCTTILWEISGNLKVCCTENLISLIFFEKVGIIRIFAYFHKFSQIISFIWGRVFLMKAHITKRKVDLRLISVNLVREVNYTPCVSTL